MKQRRIISSVALLFLVAPAIVSVASVCGVMTCSMMEASGECMHVLSLEIVQQEEDKTGCCQEKGAALSSGDDGAGDCCAMADQETPNAIAQKRAAPPEALEVSDAIQDPAYRPRSHDRGYEPIKEKPRPASSLFTLNSSFLI